MGQLMQYRRAKTPGATYFFTVVTYQRQALFHTPKTINLLRSTFHYVPDVAYPEDWGAEGKLVWDEEVGRE
jgi:hypothetical protein